jgi:hypothetical protein
MLVESKSIPDAGMKFEEFRKFGELEKADS